MTDYSPGAAEAAVPRMPSGIRGLDQILGGGLVRSGIYIVQGPPGAGKTIFGNQVCYTQAAAGRAALYVTLLSETYDRMLLNIRTMRFFRSEWIARELNYISAFRALEDEGLPGLLSLLRREIQARRPAVLVIDGLVAAEHLSPSELATKKFVHELQTHAATSDCTMLLLTSAQNATVSPEHTMVDGMIELGDQHYAWRAEREIAVRKFRGSGYLRGWHAMRIDDDGITVYPRLEAVAARRIGDKPAGRGRVTSGLAGLDEMLGGGLPESSATLVLGPTGSGKTAFGLHFLAAAPAGEAGLLVGFYESPAHLAERAAVHAPRLLPALAERQLEILWLPDAEDQVDRIAHALLENVERRGVRRLFLDGLLGLRTLTPYRERLPAFVRALGQELRARQVTALFTMEVPELIGSVVRAPATTLTPIADNLILLRYLEMGAEVRRLVSVLKVRDSGFDPRLRSFEVAPGAITIGAVFQGMEGLLSGFPRAVPDEESDPLPGPEEGPTRHQRPGR